MASSEPDQRYVIAASTALAFGAMVAVRLLMGGAPEPNVIFVVMDTVRSDHLSLCGYERPTSPNLQALADRGAAWTCDAYAPGSWTLPSHASYFTGAYTTEHGAHAITSGVNDYSGFKARSRKLNKDLPTLAEQMVDRGYQAVALSANPVVSYKLGLLRGFPTATVSQSWGELFDEELMPALDELLGGVDRDGGPLFLFVNIAEAHQPWSAVPRDTDWLPPRRRLKYDKVDPESDWRRYVEGDMVGREATVFKKRITDLYDYGVWRADKNLGLLIDRLEAGGWCEPGCRLVVTSDHGEYLGEHGLLDHGHYVWDTDVRVPLLVVDLGPDASPRDPMPAPVSAMGAYHLARDGALPEQPLQVQSAAWPHVRRCARTEGAVFCATSAALWKGEDKLLWMDGESYLIKTKQDPGEEDLLPLGDHPAAAELQTLVEAVQADARDDDEDEEVMETLRALGYVD